MPSAFDAIEYRMRRISNTTDHRDLGEALAEVDGYIDALHDFGHITEDDHSRFQKESRALRDETNVKLQKKEGHRRY
ncbi:hypothetical protein JFU47_12240 [Pseudomonas sp. TH39(2020)]|uniref:hypothetical protein n=1 Tax=Pseudomonas sp. TH39(2020) TaxID=2796349 RepID=UPI001911FF70|nr:hypothetical protein [Pseudomonas sp. TH39(2020)]MBK5397466.1 hypothetical protein [Pseudomonas sp. TH39(2020)]